MRRRNFTAGLPIAGLWAATLLHGPARAETRGVRRIGILSPGPPPAEPAQRARPFRDGMTALGWREGRDVSYEFRYGESADLDALARELMAAKVELLVTFGSDATLAARRVTDRAPIVMAAAGDPLADGLVASLARPGGNVTGISLVIHATAVKHLEILKYAVPNLKRVAILRRPIAADERLFARLRTLAPGFGLEVSEHRVTREEDLTRAFQEMSGAGAMMVLPSVVMDRWRGRIGELAIQYRLPSMGEWRVYADAGFLFAYSARLADMQRRAAVYADKILKGAHPGDIPVEQASKFEFVINLTTAWALGLTIPAELLERADEVIE